MKQQAQRLMFGCRAAMLVAMLVTMLCANYIALPAQSVTWYEAESSGMQGLQMGNYALAAAGLRSALALKPHHPRITFHLAGAYARLGKAVEALKLLSALSRTGLVYPVATEENLTSLRDSAEFKRICERFELNSKRVGTSLEAFRIPEKGLIAESVTYDPREQAFYVSSVHKGKIVRVVKGIAKDFSKPKDSLWSVLGMKVDAPRRLLWACVSALGQMEGFDESLRGASAVVCYDLTTKRRVKTIQAPNDRRNHAFGDLVVHPSGDVYVSDSETPTIYTIKRGADTLTPFITSDVNTLPSLQGMDFSSAAAVLFVADYANGIYAIDMERKTLKRLETPDSVVISGIDGLYAYKNDLIAVQNGINPPRIVRVRLDSAQTSVTSLETLEVNNPAFDDPTLGTLVGSRLYYIANSQWGLIDEVGQISEPKRLQEARIFTLDVEKR